MWGRSSFRSRCFLTEGWSVFFFFQAEDGIRDLTVTGVQTCALPILAVIGRSRDDRLAAVLAALRRAGNAGALAAIVTSEAPAGDLELMSRLQTRFGSVTLVLFDRSAYHPDAAFRAERPVPPVGTLVRATGS